MPPSKSTLINKIKRTNYLARLIKSCAINNIDLDDPQMHGWSVDEKEYVIDFYSGPQYPEFFVNNQDSYEVKSDDEDNLINDANIFSSDEESDYNFEQDESE